MRTRWRHAAGLVSVSRQSLADERLDPELAQRLQAIAWRTVRGAEAETPGSPSQRGAGR